MEEFKEKTFDTGKYKGKTYQHVRVNHPEYFLYLSAQSVGSVYRYLDFIKYCMEHLKSNRCRCTEQDLVAVS